MDTSPTSSASMWPTQPPFSAGTSSVAGAAGSSEVSYTARGSPYCASTSSASFFSALPSAIVESSFSFASASSAARPASVRIWLPSARHSSSSSPASVRPASTSIASLTSSALPTAKPSGSSMSVMTAAHLRPASVPTRVRPSASSRACAGVFIKAPDPHLTSSTITSAPAASFLDMMELTISGMLGTVPVTSRRA